MAFGAFLLLRRQSADVVHELADMACFADFAGV